MILIGNILALIASIFMVIAGIIRNKNKIIIVQSIQIFLFILSNLVLGGMTGAIINLISFFRNILCYKNLLNLNSKIILILVSTVFSIIFNNLGLIGILPLISMILYTFYMDVKNVTKFKVLMIFTTFLWFVYDIMIKSYTSSIFDIMCIIANIISIYKIKKSNT